MILANNLYQQSYKSLDTLSPNYLQPSSPTPPLTMSSSLPESPEDSRYI